MAGIELRSSAFTDHTSIPSQYSREGGDMSPPLEWSGIPEGTAELAVLCEDPDAPTGTFTHWLLARIPPSSSGLGEGEQPPEAVAGSNDFGEGGYGGPRPPAGDEPHRYFFRLYAVGEPLDLGDGFAADDLRRAMEGKLLSSGHLVGTFRR